MRALAAEIHEGWLEATRYLNMLHLKERKREPLEPWPPDGGWAWSALQYAGLRPAHAPTSHRAILSRGVEASALREGAPYDLGFANILANPLRLMAPSLAAVIGSCGEAFPACFLQMFRACLRPGGRRVHSGSADRPRGLGEPQIAAVKSRPADL